MRLKKHFRFGGRSLLGRNVGAFQTPPLISIHSEYGISEIGSCRVIFIDFQNVSRDSREDDWSRVVAGVYCTPAVQLR